MNNLIYALLVIPMVLILSVAVFNGFSANIDRGDWGASANATYTKITSGTWSGFSLGSQLPYIYIAVTVISVILGAFGLSKVF
jgi:hypothetical protein